MILRASDRQAIKREVSIAIKGDRTVPYDLRTLIEAGVSLDRIRKVYRRKNPIKSNLYEKFHQAKPASIRKVMYQEPKDGERLVMIGRISQINYIPNENSKHKGTEFYHKTGDIGTKILPHKPILAVSEDGKRFYIIPDKSTAKFTDRGIIG